VAVWSVPAENIFQLSPLQIARRSLEQDILQFPRFIPTIILYSISDLDSLIRDLDPDLAFWAEYRIQGWMTKNWKKIYS
jgi:hypothetical protein